MSHKLSWLAAVLAAACSFGVAAPTHADMFNWSYTGTSGTLPDVASGTLITGAAHTGNSAQNPEALSPGFDIVNMTGTYNGFNITLLPAGGCCTLAPLNDNILYPTSTHVLDFAGLAFQDSNGDQRGMFFTVFFGGTYFDVNALGNTVSSGNFTISPVGVPGPIAGAGLPGLIFASGGLLAWWRRRKKIA